MLKFDPRKLPKAARYVIAGAAALVILYAAVWMGGRGAEPAAPVPSPAVRSEAIKNGFLLAAREIIDEPPASIAFPVVSGMASSEIDAMVNHRLENDLGLREMLSFIEVQRNTPGANWSLDFAFEYERIGDVAHIRAIRELYTGGAHGDTEKTDLYIDTRLGTFYRLDDLFLEPGTARAAIEQAIDAAIAREPDAYFPGAAAAPLPGLFAFADDGLVITYPPYAISPYASGFVDFLIPASGVMPMVNERGAFFEALRGREAP